MKRFARDLLFTFLFITGTLGINAAPPIPPAPWKEPLPATAFGPICAQTSTCFPGFGLLTAAPAGTPFPVAGPAVTEACGELTAGRGVRLRWPDGEETVVITEGVTGLGPARGGNCSPAGEPGLTPLALDHLDAS